jgi:hypothetical protein
LILTDYRVKAASVNPIDMKVRAGVYDDYAGEYFILSRRSDILISFTQTTMIMSPSPSQAKAATRS